MNNPIVNKFCRQVGKQLQCKPATKGALLRGLSDELSEFPPDDVGSIAGIVSRIGTADEVAAELQGSISGDEIKRYESGVRKRNLIAIGGAIAICLACMLVAILLFMNGPFYIIESIQEV